MHQLAFLCQPGSLSLQIRQSGPALICIDCCVTQLYRQWFDFLIYYTYVDSIEYILSRAVDLHSFLMIRIQLFFSMRVRVRMAEYPAAILMRIRIDLQTNLLNNNLFKKFPLLKKIFFRKVTHKAGSNLLINFK